MEAGFFLRVFLRKRRYANLGHLLPMFPIERAVKTRCVGPPSRLASHLKYITRHKHCNGVLNQLGEAAEGQPPL